MNLLNLLQESGVTWSAHSANAIPAQYQDQRPRTKQGTLLERTLLLLRFPQGDPVLVWMFSSETFENAAANGLRKEPRAHDAMARWLESKGHYPVKLNVELDSLSEAMHTALRKLADSPESSTIWHALHELNRQDRVQFWTSVTAFIQQAFNLDSADPGKQGVHPNRLYLGRLLGEHVVQFWDDRHPQHIQVDGREVERTPSEKMAFIAMRNACRGVEAGEWVWSWLGYVVKRCEPDNA